MTPIIRKIITSPHFIIGALLTFTSSCSRIDHKQSALDPKGLVSQNQYDVFMLSVWITIFLFCAVGGCLLYVLWRERFSRDFGLYRRTEFKLRKLGLQIGRREPVAVSNLRLSSN